ncbi:unnamed protein product [Cyclocybe aegerita]|uniref:Uncharacterized protein n=1 Tax=Cyclocybe aegerita TaxID=1973307 RepID=A0A8S0WL50_CYCAE|nr:unnamed protein product [Cyclocybe aegerita]
MDHTGTTGRAARDSPVERPVHLFISDEIIPDFSVDVLKNITHLVIVSRAADMFILASLILERATNLQHCVLELKGTMVPPSPRRVQALGSRVITNTSLQHIELKSMPSWGPENALVLFLDRMCLPGLNTLAFKGLMLNTWGPRPFSPTGVITSFLERSTCSLDELHFNLCYGWEHDFIAFLSHSAFAGLRTLHLDEAPVTEVFFELLAKKRDLKGHRRPSCLLPNILKITYRGEKNFWWDTILKVVKTHRYPRKTKHIRPLMSLEVETYEDGQMEEPSKYPFWTVAQNFKSGVTKVSWESMSGCL